MTGILVLAFLVLIGPLAVLYGKDSRRILERGGLAHSRR